jgi:hypothetical protein
VLPRLRRWAEAEQRPFERGAILGEARLAVLLLAIYFGLRGAAWLRGEWFGF